MTQSPSAESTIPPAVALRPDPPATPALAPAPVPAAKAGRMRTRTSTMHLGLIVSAVVLVVVMIFIIQNPHTVNVGFLGAHLHLPLAVTLLLAAIAGALLMAAAGTARITQLRRVMRRDRRKRDAA
jgi:lipopolysaccharide assembly protein A